MLPYFSASRHNKNFKSAYLYVQKMIALSETNSNVEQQFLSMAYTSSGAQISFGLESLLI
jgi:hypothetical protein